MFGIKAKLDKKKAFEEEERKKNYEYRRVISELELIVDKFILTVSASDYVQSIGKNLQNYELRHISAKDKNVYFDIKNENDIQEEVYLPAAVGLAEKGTEIGAEVIVDVRPSHHVWHSDSDLYLIGTALIPKK